ncbi:SPX domain-containing protein [Skeletonema marinoi]|uniref:SPX domain-containing protein n=1 Tax=Skeletonema marinoi TaxID=267567 RepID=A0AAD8Y9H1_9STRA|nr:SPX domain-containing protein [Skeletonema marinoi]
MMEESHPDIKRRRISAADGSPQRIIRCLTDLPSGILAHAASFLADPSKVLFAVALDGNSAASPNERSSAIVGNQWSILDFGGIEKELAVKLNDEDIEKVLLFIDAVNRVKRLKLTNCVNITGVGLEPLRGSLIIEQIDLSLVGEHQRPNISPEPQISWSHVLPILDSIIEREGCSLMHLQFPQVWREEPSAESEFHAFILRYNQMRRNREEISCLEFLLRCEETGIINNGKLPTHVIAQIQTSIKTGDVVHESTGTIDNNLLITTTATKAMVGFGSSLRMSRRRGWEDAYLDYASLRLLLTQIEAVYEEEDWKARDSAASNNNGGAFFEEGVYEDYHDDDDMMEDHEDDGQVITNSSYSYMPSVFQSAWDKTRSVVTGQPIPPTRRAGSGGGGQYNKRRRKQQRATTTAREQQDSEYFEYSPSGGGGGNRFRSRTGGARGRLLRRNRRRRTNNNSNNHRHHHHHAKSSNSRGGKKDQDGGGDETNDEDDDYYDDRALDKGGWRIPGVLDYRDELFLESDDDLAFGYDEEEENEETEEEDGEWVDEEEDESNVYRYGHDDTMERGESGGYHASDGFEGNNHMDIIIESNNTDATSMGDDNRLLLPSSDDDDSNIRAELAIATTASGETISPDHHRGDSIDGGGNTIIINNNDGMRTPKSQKRHIFPSDPNNNNNIINNLLETPERTLQFTESPGVLEAGYETFAVAAARRGDMGEAMYVGSPAQQGWFDFIPNLWGDNSKQKQQLQQQQRGESRPLLFHDDEAGEDHHHDGIRGGEQESPDDDNLTNHHEDFSLGDSTHRYTSLSSKTSPASFLPAPRRLAKTTEENDQQQQDDIDSKFSFGPSAFVDREASASSSSPLPPTRYRTSPVMATAIGSSMPMTPTTPPTPTYSKHNFVDEGIEKGIVQFGVPIQMIPTEAVELLRPSSPRKSPTQSNFGSSRFYSFQNDNDGGDDNDSVGSHAHSDGGGEYNQSNMISFYSGGGRGGDSFSLRSPPNNMRYSYRQQHHHHHPAISQKMKGMPSLSSNAPTHHQFLSENPIMNLLLGRSVADWDHGGRGAIKTVGKKKKKVKMSNRGPTSHKNAASNTLPSSYPRPTARQSRAAAAAKSKRARLRKQRQLRRQRREERIPHHLRAAHVRAAAITERFRGLLRAEVEKVILFANSRLGELSDTIGCLRYSSYEDGQDDRKAHPHLADGGIHQLSSSDEEDGGGHHASDASSSSDGEAQNLDITIEQDAATRRQIITRDRMRMMRPLFQKADFLGEDFSLLSAVDEADAYAAVGVELMHLLKFVCVNIIAVRKICKKHDRLLSNRMVGGYYKRLAAEAKKSQNQGGYHHQFHWNEPQFGGTLSNPGDPASTGGYIYGIYDTKIQHIANSTTMQTVSSSLSIALADFEASQSRSARLGLGFEPTKEFVVGMDQEVPTPKHRTSSKSRGVLSYQLGGHCFRGDDDSSVASQEKDDAMSLHHPILRSRASIYLLCSYNPDAAYTLDSETLYASLKIGRENEGVGSVMVASLAAAAKGSDVISNSIRYRRKVSAALCIKPQLAGEDDNLQSSSQAKNRNTLALNSASMVLFLVNYYCVVPVAHIHSTQLGSVSSSALLIGAANVTAILSSSVHALLASKRKSFTKKHLDVSFYRIPLIVSALFPLIGNILYSLSVKKKSLEMALVGRLLVGLGSAEVLNRRLVSTVLPKESVNAEVANELVTNVHNSLENANKLDMALEEDFDSDSVGSEHAKMSSMHASKPSFDSTGTNPFASEGLLEQEEIGTHGTFEKLQVMSRKTVKNQYKGSYLESIACVPLLLFS